MPFPAALRAPRRTLPGRPVLPPSLLPGIQAPPVTTGIPAPGLLPGNQLAPADSDFESALTGNWSASNAALSKSSTHAFTGTSALKITASSTGAVTLTYGPPYLTALPDGGWDFSGWLFTAQAGITATPGIAFYTGGGAQIALEQAAAVTLTQNAWTPFAAAVGAPAGTAGSGPVLLLSGLTSGTAAWLDMAYCACAACQLLIAWQTAPFSSAPLFADMTPFLRADAGWSYSRGRQDEQSEAQTGKLPFTLDNTVIPGAFSQGNTGSPFYPDVLVARRIQLNLPDETGTFHTRFDGYLTDDETGWRGGAGLASVVAMSASDILAWVSRLPELRTMLEQDILQESSLLYLWTLDDPTHSQVAAESSGNNGPQLIPRHYGGGGTISFSSGSGIIGYAGQGFTQSLLSAVVLTPGGPSSTQGWQLEGLLPQAVTAAAGFTIEEWFSMVGSTNGNAPFAIGDSSTGAAIVVSLFPTADATSRLIYFPNAYSITAADTLSSPFTMPATEGQLVLTVSGTTARLYVNGTQMATVTVPAGFSADYIVAGGTFGNGMNTGPVSWSGSLNCLALYGAVLAGNGTRMQAHFQSGSAEYAGSELVTLMSKVATWMSIPAYAQNLPAAGVSYADAFEVTGQTPLTLLQMYEATDGGVLYANAAGQLSYQDRSQRYLAQATPVLVLQPGQYETDYTSKATDQYLNNDATYANYTIPGGVRAVNTTSTGIFERYQGSSPQSPVQGPYYSLSYYQANNAGHQAPSGDVLGDAANWTTGIYGTPAPRSPQVTIDLLTQPSSEFSRAAAFGVEIGDCIEVVGLPSSAPGGPRSAFLTVEGITESLSINDQGAEWTLTFNTTPSVANSAWMAGDPNLGILDSTAVVGRGTDGNSSPGGQYVGPPYVVPVFSASMNLTGSVGANDMRGLASLTALDIYPPCALAQQQQLAQSISPSTNTKVQFDSVLFDSVNGFVVASDNGTYTVQIPGEYLICYSVVFSGGSTGDVRAWIEQNGSETGGRGTLGITSGILGDVICVSGFTVATCAVGDTLQIWCFQSGGSMTLATNDGGCVMSVLWMSD